MQKRRTNNNYQKRKKATVLITVYVVKQHQQRRPPKLQLLSNHQTRGGTYRPLPPLKSPAGGGAPVDRKAQLLLYSQQLRATATFLKDGRRSLITTTPQPHHPPKQYSKQHLQITATGHHNKSQLAGAGHRLQITTTAGNNPRQKDVDDLSTFPWKVVQVEQIKDGVAAAEAAKLPPPPPSCFGDWKKLLFPSFCAKKDVVVAEPVKMSRRRRKKKTVIASLGRKISAVMMSSRMEKERIGVIAKFLSVIGKHR